MIVCDKCAIEISKDEAIKVHWRIFSIAEAESEIPSIDLDLCEECYLKLNKLIEKWLEE